MVSHQVTGLGTLVAWAKILVAQTLHDTANIERCDTTLKQLQAMITFWAAMGAKWSWRAWLHSVTKLLPCNKKKKTIIFTFATNTQKFSYKSYAGFCTENTWFGVTRFQGEIIKYLYYNISRFSRNPESCKTKPQKIRCCIWTHFTSSDIYTELKILWNVIICKSYYFCCSIYNA